MSNKQVHTDGPQLVVPWEAFARLEAKVEKLEEENRFLTEYIRELKLLTPEQAADALGVCKRTLLNLERSGKIEAARDGKIIRYYVDSVRNYMHSKGQQALDTHTRILRSLNKR